MKLKFNFKKKKSSCIEDLHVNTNFMHDVEINNIFIAMKPNYKFDLIKYLCIKTSKNSFTTICTLKGFPLCKNYVITEGEKLLEWSLVEILPSTTRLKFYDGYNHRRTDFKTVFFMMDNNQFFITGDRRLCQKIDRNNFVQLADEYKVPTHIMCKSEDLEKHEGIRTTIPIYNDGSVDFIY